MFSARNTYISILLLRTVVKGATSCAVSFCPTSRLFSTLAGTLFDLARFMTWHGSRLGTFFDLARKIVGMKNKKRCGKKRAIDFGTVFDMARSLTWHGFEDGTVFDWHISC